MKAIIILFVLFTVALCHGVRLSRKKCEEYNDLSQKENKCSEDKLREYSFVGRLGFRQNDEDDIAWICSVVLVSPEYVLTTAHCISNPSKHNQNAYIQLSTTNLSYPSEIHKIVQIIRHPNFHAPSAYNDLALLKMTSPVSITPACLYYGEDQEEYIVAGYGRSSHNETDLNLLLNEVNKRAKDEVCSEEFQKSRKLKEGVKFDQQFCTTEGPISCTIRSGGPLFNKDKELQCIHIVAGLVALGKGICGGTYGLHVKLTGYVDWIESVLWK